MRFVNRYKGYEKTTIVFERFPLRILKFKRPKWKKIQKLIFYSRKNRVIRKHIRKKLLSKPKSRLFDAFVNYLDPYTWYKLKNYYANGRKIRSSILMLFDKTLVAKSFKKCLGRSKKSFQVDDSYLKMIVRPEYKLDILLWRLSFFRSSYQVCQAINDKKVYVNSICVRKSTCLRKGDVVTFSNSYKQDDLIIRKIRNCFLKSKSILTFVEVDYYSNSVIIIKDLDELGLEDLNLIVKDYHSLKKLRDCL